MAFYVILFYIPIVSMPKLTVAKNCNLFSFKSNVRLSNHIFDIFSVSDSSGPKFFSQNDFNLSILTLYSLHILASLFCRMCIHYNNSYSYRILSGIHNTFLLHFYM